MRQRQVPWLPVVTRHRMGGAQRSGHPGIRRPLGGEGGDQVHGTCGASGSRAGDGNPGYPACWDCLASFRDIVEEKKKVWRWLVGEGFHRKMCGTAGELIRLWKDGSQKREDTWLRSRQSAVGGNMPSGDSSWRTTDRQPLPSAVSDLCVACAVAGELEVPARGFAGSLPSALGT